MYRKKCFYFLISLRQQYAYTGTTMCSKIIIIKYTTNDNDDRRVKSIHALERIRVNNAQCGTIEQVIDEQKRWHISYNSDYDDELGSASRECKHEFLFSLKKFQLNFWIVRPFNFEQQRAITISDNFFYFRWLDVALTWWNWKVQKHPVCVCMCVQWAWKLFVTSVNGSRANTSQKWKISRCSANFSYFLLDLRILISF
jgi:hypothetical protein